MGSVHTGYWGPGNNCVGALHLLLLVATGHSNDALRKAPRAPHSRRQLGPGMDMWWGMVWFALIL